METIPKWLRYLERRAGFLAVPQIAILLVTLQALGALFVTLNPAWAERLALIPEMDLAGEPWRLLTFLSLPVNASPVWVFFDLWFLYFITDALEKQWGAFYTTFYVLVSWCVTAGFSMATGYPVVQSTHFQSTLFLAAAVLFPEMEVLLFFFAPVKFKWMAWLTGVWVAWDLASGSWYDRGHLLAIYSNFALFFSPALVSRARAWQRRRRYKSGR